jgi:hypothetical protein
MSIATIIFEDIDQIEGKFGVNVNVEDTKLEDGFATAAHVTSMFISQAVNTPQFSEGAAAYGQAKGYSLRNDLPQRVVLTLTDVDLEAGSFDLTVAESEDAIVEGSVTAAYLAAAFVRDAMQSVEFRMACTEFAYSLTAGHSNATVNEPSIQPAVAAANSNSEQEAA